MVQSSNVPQEKASRKKGFAKCRSRPYSMRRRGGGGYTPRAFCIVIRTKELQNLTVVRATIYLTHRMAVFGAWNKTFIVCSNRFCAETPVSNSGFALVFFGFCFFKTHYSIYRR